MIEVVPLAMGLPARRRKSIYDKKKKMPRKDKNETQLMRVRNLIIEQGRGRTYDLLIRSQAPYPFGHMPLSCLTRRVWGFPASTPEKGTTAHNALIEQMSGLNFSVVSRE